jgi:hypothetical protein
MTSAHVFDTVSFHFHVHSANILSGRQRFNVQRLIEICIFLERIFNELFFAGQLNRE